MKSPDKIKKSLRTHFLSNPNGCAGCAYKDESAINCTKSLFKDIRSYYQQLERERDAAVKSLRGNCLECRWQETAKCASCIHDIDAWNTHDDNWEWRGVEDDNNGNNTTNTKALS